MTEGSEDQHAMVAQFCDLTGATTGEAQEYLVTSEWNLDGAVAEYFTSQEEGVEQAQADHAASAAERQDEPSFAPGGPRTLGGGPVPPSAIPTVSSSKPGASASKTPTNKKFATLKDLSSDASHSHAGHKHSDDDDDDDEQHDLFAGGEKSALAVQTPGDPRKQVKDILNKAKKNMPRPGGDDPTEPVSRFRGTGMTLGGDDTPSQAIPDPDAETLTTRRAPVARILHFWKDGFSVENGHLYRFDDPGNGHILSLIRAGRAPLDIMGVEPDQPVDVTVHQHEDNYVQPEKKYKPFSGGGQRLGSPTPHAVSSDQPSTRATSTGTTSATAGSASSAVGGVNVDDAQPTISLQIRLGDGTRLSSRFNTTHTIGDVYSFVNASGAQSTQRDWVLMTTFPSKELTDKSVVLGDLAEFKRGGVVVQKWS